MSIEKLKNIVSEFSDLRKKMESDLLELKRDNLLYDDAIKLDNQFEAEADLKECPTCGVLKISSPTPDGDEICPSCGDTDLFDYEEAEGQNE